ncbi:MAG: hypothetical protein IKM13_07230, partial [Clostridia bacterium]|nr:hypothetical protein [Clostridia bacterium]
MGIIIHGFQKNAIPKMKKITRNFRRSAKYEATNRNKPAGMQDFWENMAGILQNCMIMQSSMQVESWESFCGTGHGIMTWFCVRKIFGPVEPEKTVICDRSAFAERSCRGRTKGRKARMSARPGPPAAWG